MKYGTFVYVIDVQFLFLMTIKTFENLYVVHHGNYVLKIARVLKMTLLTAFRLLVWIYTVTGNKCLSSPIF